MIVERLLRLSAVVIALLGLVDPASTVPWRERPIVGVAIVQPSPAESSAATLGAADATSLRALQARVISALQREFDVRRGLAPDAAAVVLIGDGRSPANLSLPDRTPASAVVPDATGRAVRIVDIDAPKAAHVSTAVPIAVQLESVGLAGRSTTIVVRSNGLDLARATHVWRDATERTRITLNVPPPQTGPTRFTALVLDDAATATPSSRSSDARSGDDATASTGTRSNNNDNNNNARGTSAEAPPPPVASADVAVEIHDRPLRVLIVNPRPSWATQFVRRALDADRRFAVAVTTRVSRGVTATTTGAPASTALASANLDAFDAIVVGAPEMLTKADVETLRAFARVRGGVLVFMPDRRPDGPVLDLLPMRGFSERLLSEAVALRDESNVSGEPRDSVTPHASATSPSPDPDRVGARGTETPPQFAARERSGPVPPASTLWTSELAIPREPLLPGAEALLAFDDPTDPTDRTNRTSSSPPSSLPIVVGSPLGDGYVIASGALDAWRFRDRGDAAFDRFWRDTIAARAAAVPDPIEVTLHPAIAAPGDRVDVRVDLRGTAIAASAARDASTPTALRAELVPLGSRDTEHTSEARALAPSTAPAATMPVRLWPDARPSAYHGVLNAPSRDGVYAVSVRRDAPPALPAATTRTQDRPASAPAAIGRAALYVAGDVHVTRMAWPGLQAFVEARGGRLVTAREIDRLAEHLRASIGRNAASKHADGTSADRARDAAVEAARHPFRSAWWILPFAACLGGEWLLRRRRGAR